MESIGTTPHKGLCTLFDRGKYIWNGSDESNEKKDRMEKVKKCQFPESRATNCLSNRFNRPLNNRKKHFHSVEENCSGIINGKKNNDCTFDIKKCKITKWKSHNSASHSDDQQTGTKSLGYCHGNCCKTKSKFCKEGKLSQMMKKEEDSKLGTKTSCNHSPKSTPNSFSHNHHHYQQATGHQTKDQCGKLESPHELDVHHRIKPSGRQNYSSCPGAKNVNQLLAPRDNESHICRHESYQLSENNQQLRYNPSLKHFEIVSKKSVIDDNIKKQVSTDDECDTKKLKLFKEIPEIPTTLLLHRSRSLPQLSAHDSGVESVHDNNVPARCHSKLVSDLRQLLTLKQHYYPEGGWGWIILVVCIFIQILSHGTHGAVGVFVIHVATKFNTEVYLQAGWLGAMSTGVALLVSPVTIAFCRRKSTRVTAVLGGLVTALGCLFTSFASQFHQLFFSYGAVVGIGVGITRDCSTLMVAQYFKRRREFVEIFIVSGSGLGIAVMSAFIKGAIGKIGWRLGLQAVTGVVFLTFILGTFYRSASLYHPQRRAILHLKNQKRKIKDKNKVDDRPPFFDFSTLKSKTVRILLISTGISAFGITTPIFYLAHQVEEEGLGDNVVLLQAYLGLAWTVGCITFGVLVVNHSVECRIARQYLTQTAVFMCGICILALTAVHGNYHGYVMFTWIYGIFCGGYHYSLKMYTYERVRARNFARTWGFVQCSQAIPIAIGVPISGYMNVGCGGKAGYYFSSTCVLVGSFTLFFIDLHKRNLSKHKHTKSNGTKHTCASDNCPQRRRLSFTQDPDYHDGVGGGGGGGGASTSALNLGNEIVSAPGVDKPELTCISEEGIADMDLPDNILDDIDYIGDCITSCNKVENYLMLSEFENNLIAEMPINIDRKGRRWSLAKSKGHQGNQCSHGNGKTIIEEEKTNNSKWRLNSIPINDRAITVIDEASTSHVEYR
ncbi:hypothetical protein PV328_010802 [Microctonus aethiopoides]|uniref:Uncharacterized protein n=1 Tax=Microctonus aethiopoides TaxID=144406 RepID=A0AA39KQN6_9HYME|nr:hypothetical protein PV328_010802 [Microctonus aethiopoides]